MATTRRLIAASAATFIVFPAVCYAQTSPNCPFLGAVFPTPSNVLDSSTAVPQALSELRTTLQQSLSNGVLENTTTTFYLSAFSTGSKLFDFAYAAPSLNGSLTSGVLDENTVFRIGSVSKLLTVYTILAEVGMDYMNDPVTKWVPELALEDHRGSINAVEAVDWDDITVGALASQMAGINRDRKLS
jgi:CubicO group peptidase (beta-lactamase class C family)